MIIFIYGEDTYRSWEKLSEIKRRYVEKYGAQGVQMLEGSKLNSFGELQAATNSQSLFGGPALVIVRDLLTATRKENLPKEIAKNLAELDGESTVIFYEGGQPDRRKALYKKLVKEKSEELALLKAPAVAKWVREWAQEQGLKIAAGAITLLVSHVGSDLWRMTSELRKLQALGRDIAEEDILRVVYADHEANLFELTDGLVARDVPATQKALRTALDQEVNEFLILGTIGFTLRTLAVIRDLYDQGMDRSAIAGELKLHPFVFLKTYAHIKKHTLKDLRSAYRKLILLEKHLKRSEVSPAVGLTTFIMRICQPKTN